MANSIDLAAICVGAAIGYGLRNEIRSTGEVCRNALLSGIAGAAATVAAPKEEAESQQPQVTGQSNKKNA